MQRGPKPRLQIGRLCREHLCKEYGVTEHEVDHRLKFWGSCKTVYDWRYNYVYSFLRRIFLTKKKNPLEAREKRNEKKKPLLPMWGVHGYSRASEIATEKFSHSCVIHCLMKYTKGDAPSLQDSKLRTKFLLGYTAVSVSWQAPCGVCPWPALPEAEILCLVWLLIWQSNAT